MALGLRPQRALINDINPHAINFYRWLKKGLKITIPMENDRDLFYEHRETFNRLGREGKADTKVAASLFYYLNKTGYNGLCRFNQKGEFNVPFGRYKSISYKRDFLEYRTALQNWDLRCTDFEKLKLNKTDLIYADPPYDVEFTQYTDEGFTWDDQERLAAWITRHPGPAIISNQATERIVALYQACGFYIEYRDVHRLINCKPDRPRAREVIAIKGVDVDGA